MLMVGHRRHRIRCLSTPVYLGEIEEALRIDIDRPSEELRVGGPLGLVEKKSVRMLAVESAIVFL